MTIKHYQIERHVKRLSPPQAKILLDFMGIPLRDQGTKLTEIKKQLQALGRASVEDFDKYYNLVVNHKWPENEQAEIKTLSKEDTAKLLEAMSQHVTYLESNYTKEVNKKVDARVATASEEVRLEARKEIDAARKEFITYRVKVGTKKPKPIGGVVPRQFERLIQLAQSRKNILMVGPSGCGKTHVASMIADALDLDYSAQSCSAGISESVFTGWLLPIGDNGKFDYVMSEFVRIYENGGVFLLDEFDNTDANLGVFLNMAIAQDHFYLPQRFGHTKIKKHKDFVCVAAANTFGHGADAMYVGRTQLDAATLDRFKLGTVAMDYDPSVEQHLINHGPLLEWGRGLRKIIDKHSLQKVLSTRVLIDAFDMIRDHDWTLDDVEQTFFQDWEPEERMMIASDLRDFKSGNADKNEEAA